MPEPDVVSRYGRPVGGVDYKAFGTDGNSKMTGENGKGKDKGNIAVHVNTGEEDGQDQIVVDR